MMGVLIRSPYEDTGAQKHTGVTMEAEIGVMLPSQGLLATD